MDISVLREFTWLAKDLSFTKAAARCHISQSVLSRHIQALEQEVGCQLLTRENNQVLLTSAGDDFAKRMKALMASYDEAVAKARDIRDEYEGALRVAYNSSLAAPFLDQAYALQLERHPQVKVNLMASWEERIATMLAQGRADVGVMMPFGELDPKVYGMLALYEDGYSVLVPAHHPLAAFEEASLDDLQGETLLMPVADDSVGQHEYLSEALGKVEGAEVHAVLADKHDNVALTNAGRGLALVRSRQVSGLALGSAVAVPLKRDELSYKVAAVWRQEDASPVVRGFVEVLEEATQAL